MKNYAYILVICSIIGLAASFLLTIDTMRLVENPGIDLPCNVNPFISCTSVINSPQGKIFGFANPLLGIAGFSFVLATGILTLFGAVPSRRFWQLFTIGITLATILLHWFIYQSIFVLGSLCLYCMITWSVTFPIFLYTLKNFKADITVGSPTLRRSFLERNHLAILIGWYLLIILLILIRFHEFFIA